jgi:hypothetical protein
MNAQAFSATSPDGVSGRSEGYPSSATSQYHCASQPSTKSASPASAPKRDSDVEADAAIVRRSETYLQDRFGQGLDSFAVPDAAFPETEIFEDVACRA